MRLILPSMNMFNMLIEGSLREMTDLNFFPFDYCRLDLREVTICEHR